jgi:hypothetical protein
MLHRPWTETGAKSPSSADSQWRRKLPQLILNHVTSPRPPLWSSGQNSWLQNIDVLCFLWGMNSIYICYVEESRPPLWSSGQSSWLQIQRSEFQIFWEVVGLERGPLSLTEELLGRKSSGSGLEHQRYGCRDLSGWPRITLYLQKLALTSLTNGGHSAGKARSRTKAMELLFNILLWMQSI